MALCWLPPTDFVAFLRVHHMTADGCPCANYCTFAVCEGVLLWFLVKEPDFEVPSEYSWEVVAWRPFKVGHIECKVNVRSKPPKKVRTRQSQKLASTEKKAAAECRRRVLAGSDADSEADVPTLAPDN